MQSALYIKLALYAVHPWIDKLPTYMGITSPHIGVGSLYRIHIHGLTQIGYLSQIPQSADPLALYQAGFPIYHSPRPFHKVRRGSRFNNTQPPCHHLGTLARLPISRLLCLPRLAVPVCRAASFCPRIPDAILQQWFIPTNGFHVTVTVLPFVEVLAT